MGSNIHSTDHFIGAETRSDPVPVETPLCSFDRVWHDPANDVYWTRYERGTDDPSIAVASVVATTLRREPFELEPLYEVVDPEAVNALFRSQKSTPSELAVQFQYEDCDVVVESETIVVHPRSGTEEHV